MQEERLHIPPLMYFICDISAESGRYVSVALSLLRQSGITLTSTSNSGSVVALNQSSVWPVSKNNIINVDIL